MLNKLRNFFVSMNIDEAIENIFLNIDNVQSDIDYAQSKKKDVSPIKIGELTAYQNAVRRLKKLKEKYK